MSPNDYVKFMTEEVVKYMELPKEKKKERKQRKKAARKPWSITLFGIIPLALSFVFRRKS
ncbi:hypothetical protein N784_00500 [Pontibacillus litoralis JSM 072002]|uniref:YqzE family protein n=2 Tax=Pontibacillus TaxID=289201 RepID=A0A0A5G6V4_9BACI|nr:hypothetical protein N784_00500 [Pontibacillus litoralis JSM 072002]